MKTKKKSQYQHAQKRASHRYGLTIGPKTYDLLCKKIQNHDSDCIFLYKQSNRVTLYAVFIDEQWVPVVYDKDRHSVVTFLPETALNPFWDKLHAKAAKSGKLV